MCDVPPQLPEPTTPGGGIPITRPHLAMPGEIEHDWRWCKNCQGLHFAPSGTTRGTCPTSQPRGQTPPVMVIGPHSVDGSGNYSFHRSGPTTGCVQASWFKCADCKGLFFGPRKGRCPANKTGHSATGADYKVHTCNAQGGQEGWRWCHKCELMFFSLNPGSVCAAGGAHDGSKSGTYFI